MTTAQSRGYLHIAGILCVLGYAFQFRSSGLPIIHGIVAIRGVKQIDVAASRIEARLDDLLHLIQTRGSHSASAAGHFEEIGLAEFPGFGGVGYEHDVERAILTPQTGGNPKKEGLRQLAITFGHARGYVQ